MSDNAFVDTNILLYARDRRDPVKHATAVELLEELWRKKSGRLSVQVLNEYYVNVRHKLTPGLDDETAWSDVQLLTTWDPIALDTSLLFRGRDFQKNCSVSWWDALILAAAERAKCPVIYTEDLNHGQEYFSVRVVNPFHRPCKKN